MLNKKQVLNSLCCPICTAQIDISVKYKDKYCTKYVCAYDEDHYVVLMSDTVIKYETINIYDMVKLLKYEITQTYVDLGAETTIVLKNIDAEGRTKFTWQENVYKTNLALFNFRKFNSETAINKIKTVLVFG
jgi:hypothetical protein